MAHAEFGNFDDFLGKCEINKNLNPIRLIWSAHIKNFIWNIVKINLFLSMLNHHLKKVSLSSFWILTRVSPRWYSSERLLRKTSGPYHVNQKVLRTISNRCKDRKSFWGSHSKLNQCVPADRNVLETNYLLYSSEKIIQIESRQIILPLNIKKSK